MEGRRRRVVVRARLRRSSRSATAACSATAAGTPAHHPHVVRSGGPAGRRRVHQRHRRSGTGWPTGRSSWSTSPVGSEPDPAAAGAGAVDLDTFCGRFASLWSVFAVVGARAGACSRSIQRHPIPIGRRRAAAGGASTTDTLRIADAPGLRLAGRALRLRARRRTAASVPSAAAAGRTSLPARRRHGRRRRPRPDRASATPVSCRGSRRGTRTVAVRSARSMLGCRTAGHGRRDRRPVTAPARRADRAALRRAGAGGRSSRPAVAAALALARHRGSAGGARTCRPTSSASPSSSATASRSGTTSGTAATTRSATASCSRCSARRSASGPVAVLSAAAVGVPRRPAARAGRPAAAASSRRMWFAVATVTNITIGRLPFALGIAVALGALVAAQGRRMGHHDGADGRHGRGPAPS